MRFILIMILAISPICFGLRADLNRDGIVNQLDLWILSKEWLMSEYGTELVNNYSFTTDTIWTKSDGWTINTGTGKAVFIRGATGLNVITQPITLVAGKTYKITVIISNTAITAGKNFTAGLFVNNSYVTMTADGTYTLDVTPTIADDYVAISGNALSLTDTFSVDSISLKEISNVGSLWEQALMQTLYGDGAVAAYLGSSTSGIYNSYASSSKGKPFVIYSQISGPRDQTFDGPSGLATIHIQLNSFASTYLEARTIADVIRRKLDGFEGTVSLTGGGSCKILETKLTDEGDVPTEQSDTIVVYGKRQDYEMVIDERP